MNNKLIAINMAAYQPSTKRKVRNVDRYMIYVIYLASLAVPLYLFRVVIEETIMSIRGGY